MQVVSFTRLWVVGKVVEVVDVANVVERGRGGEAVGVGAADDWRWWRREKMHRGWWVAGD